MMNDPKQIAQLALGRILRLASRPNQPGDVEEYEHCRAIILDALAPETPFSGLPVHCWMRDRTKGAGGDY